MTAGRFEGRSPRDRAIIAGACCCAEDVSDSPDRDRFWLTFLEEVADSGGGRGGRLFSWGLFLPLPLLLPLLVRETWPRCIFAIGLVIPDEIA